MIDPRLIEQILEELREINRVNKEVFAFCKEQAALHEKWREEHAIQHDLSVATDLLYNTVAKLEKEKEN